MAKQRNKKYKILAFQIVSDALKNVHMSTLNHIIFPVFPAQGPKAVYKLRSWLFYSTGELVSCCSHLRGSRSSSGVEKRGRVHYITPQTKAFLNYTGIKPLPLNAQNPKYQRFQEQVMGSGCKK